jgi:hypothetical protein
MYLYQLVSQAWHHLLHLTPSFIKRHPPSIRTINVTTKSVDLMDDHCLVQLNMASMFTSFMMLSIKTIDQLATTVAKGSNT